MKTLSICIGTYNRKSDLQELVQEILTSDNDDFLVEVTDNCSTDGTIDMLNDLHDERVVIHKNQKNIGGNNNMVRSVFNGSSKYALYLNDREIFDGTKLDALVSILRDIECSYLYCTRFPAKSRKGESAEYDIKYYNAGLESFQKHGYAHHPSGSVFNSELIKKNFKYEDYQNLGGNFKFSMLACDLMALGKTAEVDIEIWNERPREYLRDHVSGYDDRQLSNPEKCYFHPYQSEIDVKVAINHILINKFIKIEYTETDIVKIALGIVSFHYKTLSLMCYKTSMFSRIMCGHYRLKRQFISTAKMISLYNHFYKSNISYIKELGLPKDIINILEKKRNKELVDIIINSLKYDVLFLLLKW